MLRYQIQNATHPAICFSTPKSQSLKYNYIYSNIKLDFFCDLNFQRNTKPSCKPELSSTPCRSQHPLLVGLSLRSLGLAWCSTNASSLVTMPWLRTVDICKWRPTANNINNYSKWPAPSPIFHHIYMKNTFKHISYVQSKVINYICTPLTHPHNEFVFCEGARKKLFRAALQSKGSFAVAWTAQPASWRRAH